MDNSQQIKKAYSILKTAMEGDAKQHGLIMERAQTIVQMLGLDESVTQRIVYDFESKDQKVIVQEPDYLTSDLENYKWFEKKKEIIKHRLDSGYSARYAKYLRDELDFDEDTILGMQLSSEKILKQCANPDYATTLSNTKLHKRGLVVGDVQSGKTANYLSLINLACDYGYEAIVLLAGMTDSLRVQTQKRIDSGFIGAVSSTIGNDDITYIGVGIPELSRYAIPFTDTESDYVKFINKHNHTMVSDLNKPVVLVVKKNVSVLRQVAEKLRNETQKKNILIIDDEADNASVNTKKPDSDPSAINGKIRDIFNDFPVATYVGFTATPFANIFINPYDDESYKDLFPSDFIVQLKSPNTYFGSTKVFSYDENGKSKHIRVLDENEPNFLSVKHKKGQIHFSVLPFSLKEAVLNFLIANVVRTIRGADHKHRSMMINISVINDMHEEIKDVVQNYIDDLCNIIEQDDFKSTDDFIKNRDMLELYNIYNGLDAYQEDDFYSEIRKIIPWEDIKKGLLYEIKQIKVVIINNKHKKDRFDYDSKEFEEHGARVIVIGGYVLSRGLTLEGLMTSYFSRNSSAYDSLLQMCRWFGYRPKFEDLCRIYMSQINIMNFRAVVDAVENLKLQFSEMALKGKRPEDYGLMVQEAPDILETTLLVTARNKSKSTDILTHYINYGGHYADTSKLYKDNRFNSKNIQIVDEMISEIRESGIDWVKYIPEQELFYDAEQNAGKKMFLNVDAKIISKYIAKLQLPIENTKFDTENLSQYIRESEIYKNWDIVVASGSYKQSEYYDTPIVSRSFQYRDGENYVRIGNDNNRIMDPRIFESGLTENQIKKARIHSEKRADLAGKKHPKSLSAIDYLSTDVGRKNPLLAIYPMYLDHKDKSELREISDTLMQDKYILGFAIGFPSVGENSKEKMTYRVNMIKKAEIENSRYEAGLDEEELYDED